MEDTVDPVRDLETIQNELCKKDLSFLDAAEAKEVKEVKCTPGYKLSLVFKDTVAKCRELLQANKPIRDGEWSSPEVFKVFYLKIYLPHAGFASRLILSFRLKLSTPSCLC